MGRRFFSLLFNPIKIIKVCILLQYPTKWFPIPSVDSDHLLIVEGVEILIILFAASN
jgi:hypothetical protein